MTSTCTLLETEQKPSFGIMVFTDLMVAVVLDNSVTYLPITGTWLFYLIISEATPWISEQSLNVRGYIH